MTYWVAVCESDTNPGVILSGPGRGSVNCVNADGTSANQTFEVQLMVVPPAGSGFDGFWQLASISVDDALVISASIAALWALAWGFREIRNVISSRSSDDEE